MLKWLFFLLPLFIFAHEERVIVCIHGFMGHSFEMKFFEGELKKLGWNVINWGYPSRDATIYQHAAALNVELQRVVKLFPHTPIYFVAYSMGGLILRAAVNQEHCPYEAKIGKAVLLGTPNQGASWGRFLSTLPLTHKLAKEFSGKELMTHENFDHLGEFPLTMQLLVIAGNLSFNPFIDGENDGTVGVHETYLNTPHLHFVLPLEHKMMLISRSALSITKEFFYD